jgi:transcriptional regulator with XRE-family HTH domain
MTADQLRERIRIRLEKLRITQKEYAKMCGYSEQYLSDFLSGNREPGEKILKAECLKAVTYYEQSK